MTARLWITVLGAALNTMHRRRARVLASQVSAESGQPPSAVSIGRAILIAVALGASLVLIKTGVLILG